MDVSTALSFSIWFMRWLLTVEALDSPPTNSRAALYRAASLYFFLIFAALFLCASLLHVFGNRWESEIVGWTGMGCFAIAAHCAVKYASVKGPSEEGESRGSAESFH